MIAGPVRIVRLPYGVGVLADTPWAAFEARQALTQSVTWTRTGTAWGFDSDKGMERFAADAKNPARGATEWSRVGDLRAEMPKAASTMEAEYRCDYAYHAQMEPLNAIASVAPAGDSVEIWAGTQSQSIACEAPAKLLGIPRDKVKLNDMLMGGGFGRRGNRDVDFIIDAVLLSKEAGRPVKVMWTREDDVHNGRFRPISAHYLKAGFDPSGNLAAWHHRIAVDRVGPYMDPVRYQMSGGKDFIAMLGADLRGYDVPHQLIEQLYRDTGVRTNPLRGISVYVQQVRHRVIPRRDRAQARARPCRLPPRALEKHAARKHGGAAGGADGGLGAQARRSRARLRLSRLFRLTGCRHRRGVARSRERADQGAQFLVHHRLRRRGSAR